MAALTSDCRIEGDRSPCIKVWTLVVGCPVSDVVKLGVELFTPPDHSVEFSDECSVFLLEVGDVVSSQTLLPPERLLLVRGLVAVFRCHKFFFLAIFPLMALQISVYPMICLSRPSSSAVSSPSAAQSLWIPCRVLVVLPPPVASSALSVMVEVVALGANVCRGQRFELSWSCVIASPCLAFWVA